MTKNQRILLGIALTLLIGIAIATPAASSSEIILYAFDQNPALYESCTEWVTLNNPTNANVEIGNWTLENADDESETIPEGTTLYPGAYYVYYFPYQWLDNENETITLSDSEGNVVDETPLLSDTKDDNRCWVRNDSEWVFELRNEFVKPTPEPSTTPMPALSPVPMDLSKLGESGIVTTVIDGDTIEIEDVGRIRFADIDAHELDTEEGKAAKEYVKGLCEGKEVYLDIDDFHIIDKYGRIVAVVYSPYNETHRVNINQLLLIEGYAEAREYHNEFNPAVWMESPLEYVDMTPTLEPTITPWPSQYPAFLSLHAFGFLLTIIGLVAAIYLVRRKREG